MKRRWTPEEAWQWWNSRPWIMGLNYVPSCTPGMSIWQEDTRDEAMKTVLPQVKLMQEIGFNSVRMMVPFDIWYYDRDRLLDRLDEWLGILDEHGIGMMPVVGNDCVKFGRPDDITVPRYTGPQPLTGAITAGMPTARSLGIKSAGAGLTGMKTPTAATRRTSSTRCLSALDRTGGSISGICGTNPATATGSG